jgi:hypothetical protein
MKNRETILATVVSLIVQIGIGYAVYLATGVMAYHWHDYIGGKALPPLINMTLRFGMAVPIGASLLILVGVSIPFFRTRVHWWICGVVLLEALLLAIAMLGLAAPGSCITYQI